MYVSEKKPRVTTAAKSAGRAVRKWWNKDRQIIFRSEGRVRFVRLSDVLQFTGLAVGLWIVYSTVSYFVLQKTITDKDVEIAVSNRAYHEMLGEIVSARRRFQAISSSLERNDLHILRLSGQNEEIKGDLEKLRKTLQRRQKESSEASGLGRFGERHISLAETEMLVAQQPGLLSGEEDGAHLFRHDRLGRQLLGDDYDDTGALDTKRFKAELARLRKAEEQLVAQIGENSERDVRHIRKVVRYAGLNVDRMLRKTRRGLLGQGGPFIPFLPFLSGSTATPFAKTVTAMSDRLERWQRHQMVFRSMPIGAPLKRYYLASQFGKRLDPINNRWALHGGTDLSYPLGTKVHTMAPGRVRIAGWLGPFGRMIEIDHGMGIRSRYAHLQKILVKRRERVEYGQVIGLLGSSGRSTGPHLHYEIHVNRQRVDPIRFIKAGKYVFKE